MNLPEQIRKTGQSVRRILIALIIALAIPALIYLIWQPGEPTATFEYPNYAIWLGHGWLGDDSWFLRNHRESAKFRTDSALIALMVQLQHNKIKTVYPHLCPAQRNGEIAPYDAEQLKRFLDQAQKHGITVIPWIGGVFEESARVDDPNWRKNFVDSVAELLSHHPRIAGVQINIEPMPSGNVDLLLLLEELHPILQNRILSVAAYPPPSMWQPSPDVHWTLEYLHEVAKRSDQLAVMMYDTGIRWEKFYIQLMKQWTQELILTVEQTDCALILGIPAYEDADSGYHLPTVEHINSALSGIGAAKPGSAISGIALYCEWEMTPLKWQTWQKRLGLTQNASGNFHQP